MAKIEREIKHSLGLEGAKAAVQKIVEKLQQNYGSLLSDFKWNEDKTAADLAGKGFKGNFRVGEDNIKLHVELGMLASAFKGKIESQIDEELKDIK